ncbi:nuclear transport factor 2 family protein [Levilactobacillus zymae]|uniref:nuclear transport factor 2 family protein n=1 Tax=Levilactobacillus zymae TaxID=267363 RepID=UPI003FCEA231
MTDKEVIIQLYRDENTAMVQKNIGRLNEILADGMTLTHMTGYVQPKFEWIDQIQNDEMQYLASQEEAIQDVHIDGNQASLVGQNRVQAKIWGGGEHTWPLQMRMTYHKQAGKWRITSQVASTY